MGWDEHEGIDEWDLENLRDPSDAEMVFPASALEFLPSIKCIGTRAEAYDWQDSNWGKIVSRWFFSGGKFPSKRKDGFTDAQISKVLKIVKLCMGTFACSHEQKIGGIAWILNKHFEWTDEEQKQIE